VFLVCLDVDRLPKSCIPNVNDTGLAGELLVLIELSGGGPEIDFSRYIHVNM
jgi:hypothetical protein